MQKVKILYFIESAIPTPEQFQEVENIQAKVCFRNSRFIDPNGSLEDCNFIMGNAPKKYKMKFPFWGNEPKKEIEKEVEQIEIKPSAKPVWKPN